MAHPYDNHPFCIHLHDWMREHGYNARFWLDDRSRFIAQSWCRTDLPEYAVLLLESEETHIPETGETSVSQTWICCCDDDIAEIIGFVHDEWKEV